jgi:hypothetical protein
MMKENNMEGLIAKQLGSPYRPNIRSEEWKKMICWSYYNVLVTKVTCKPLTFHLQDFSGNFVGSIFVDVPEISEDEFTFGEIPFACKIKARGWTLKRKLRHPEIIEIP